MTHDLATSRPPILLCGPQAIGKTTLARILRDRGLDAEQGDDTGDPRDLKGAFCVLLLRNGVDTPYDPPDFDLVLRIPWPRPDTRAEGDLMWGKRADAVVAALCDGKV